MIPEQNAIWDYLVSHAQGINLAVHINVIAREIDVAPNGTNNDNVRRWIKQLIVKYGRPIGTCPNGAFIIMNDNEREEAARFVERRTVADAIRENGNYIPL